MSDINEIRELTGEETVEQIAAYCAAKGIDVTKTDEFEGELSESDLEMVAGGMGHVQACAILLKFYYQMKRTGTTTYSRDTVVTAYNKVYGAGGTVDGLKSIIFKGLFKLAGF